MNALTISARHSKSPYLFSTDGKTAVTITAAKTPTPEDVAAKSERAFRDLLDAVKLAGAAEMGRAAWDAANADAVTRNPADAERDGAASALRRARTCDPGAPARLVESVSVATREPELRAIVAVLLDTEEAVALDRARAAWAKAGIVTLRTSQMFMKDAAQARRMEEAQAMRPGDMAAFKALDAGMVDHRVLVAHAIAALVHVNGLNPTFFSRDGRFMAIRHDPDGVTRMAPVDGLQPMASLLSRWGLYVRQRGEGKAARFVGASTPLDVARDVFFHPDPARFALPLAAVRATPFFDAEGGLVAQDGYHAGSRTYLTMTPELRESVAEVAVRGWTPTAEEAKAAAIYLIQELVADFPLDGATREETMAAVRAGRPAPSVAALLGLLVLPFVRELVDGPTPGHIICKPSPGTGASLLADLVSLVTTGADASPLTMPTTREEIGKTLASLMYEGAELALFDNISSTVSGAELASALTARRFKARVLGSTAMMDVPVRATFLFTGNGVTASGELARRLTPILLDARTPDPTARGGWRHADLLAFVRRNRGQIVAAILTIIRRWVAMGQPAPSCRPLASFESWSHVVGGVVEHGAGLRGFLDGRAAWRAEAVEGDDVERLVAALAQAGDGTTIRVRARKAGDGHASLLDLLRDLGDAGQTEDPLALPGWGYEAEPGRDGTSYTYGRAGVVGKQFGKAARRPWAVRVDGAAVVVSFEERVAPDNSKSWRMTVAKG